MKRFAFLTVFILANYLLFAQTKGPQLPVELEGETHVLYPVKFMVTHPENLLNSKSGEQKSEEFIEMNDRDNRVAQTFQFTSADGPQYGTDPSSIQTVMGNRTPANVLLSWYGQNGYSSPQDPTGAVGLTQYVQGVNATPFAVYNKNGNGSAVYTGSINTATGVGSQGNGDPVVLYDKFADRWLVAELYGNSGFAVAISQTNNPAGAWNAYQYSMPSGQMPDYLKLSVWENGYYMTSNNGHGTVYCLERSAMLTGSTSARFLYRTFTTPTNAGYGFWLPLPGDADGVIPPAGQRCPLFSYTDNGWGSGISDAIKIWSMGVTWSTTPTATITVDATINVSSFDASYNSQWDDITQPGSQMLDGLGGVCMFRAQWNNFPGTNRVVLNWAVKVTTPSTHRTIKWVELRQNQTTGTWSLYQEGVYSPDVTNRWNGSIAMDVNGNIALCYAKTSSTIPVSLAFTGRMANDTLGQMTLPETVVFTGTGQITGSNRFGDYSHTSLDPVHNDIFWHTGMFSHNGSVTGIYSFQLQPYTTGISNPSQPKTELNATLQGKLIFVKATQLPNDGESVLQLFDISGHLLSDAKIKPVEKGIESTINADRLSSGTYIVRIGNDKYQKVTKIVIP